GTFVASLGGNVSSDFLVIAKVLVTLVGSAIHFGFLVEIVIGRRRCAHPLKSGRAPRIGRSLAALLQAVEQVNCREQEAHTQGKSTNRRKLMQALELWQVVVVTTRHTA